jgi:hypothetical protein
MSGARLYLLIGACVVTALIVFSIIAHAIGRGMIDGRVFVALSATDVILWTGYTITTCTHVVLQVLIEQRNVRSQRVAEMIENSGIGDLDGRRRAKTGSS